MKTIVILMALLFVGLTSNAQERSRAAWLRVNEIMKKKRMEQVEGGIRISKDTSSRNPSCGR